MTVVLEYTAQLKRAAGTAREELTLPAGATLSAALSLAGAQHGDDFRRLLLDDTGRRLPTLLVFHCDRQVSAAADPPLADGDTVTVLSPMSGG